MTTNPTRAIDITFDNGDIVGKAVWAWGECTIITPVESRREPRLDTTSNNVVDLLIWAIRNHDPSGSLEFLWQDYVDAA